MASFLFKMESARPVPFPLQSFFFIIFFFTTKLIISDVFLKFNTIFFSFTFEEINRNYLHEMMLSTTHLTIEITLEIIYIGNTILLKYNQLFAIYVFTA